MLAVALLDEVVHQFAGAVVHLDVERLHLIGEEVECHDGGDGDEEAERGGDQGLGDTAGDRANARGLLQGDLLEGVEDTDDGPEQTDEGSCGADGCQTAKASLELGMNDRLGPFQGALRTLNLLLGDIATRAEAAELLQAGVTTSARCDFLLRSPSLIASSRRPSFSAPATLGANSRDCLRAALKYSHRSIMTANDQMDMMNRMMAMMRAGQPILEIRPEALKLTVPPVS